MTMLCNNWKIFVIASFISLISSEASKKSKEANINDAFGSITYNLVLDPDFDESTLGGHLQIAATTKQKVSKIILKKKNYQVSDVYLMIDFEPIDDIFLESKDEFLVLNLRSGLRTRIRFLIVMNFEGAKMHKVPYKDGKLK